MRPKLPNAIADAYLHMLEVRTPDQVDHGRKVHDLARELALRYAAQQPEDNNKLSPADVDLIGIAALFHDIGKTGTPPIILDKPAALSPDEWDVIHAHPILGAEMLLRTKLPAIVATIVRSHHEHWDGSGYPDGLHTTQIPIGARIIAIADAYDAMMSHRAYRPAMTASIALATLQASSGAEWDPEIVDIFTTFLTTRDGYRDVY